MPILSALSNTAYKRDGKFKPVTVFFHDDVPDYGLAFDVTSGYRGDTFAFDVTDSPSRLVSGDYIDDAFFVSRYERLFRYKLDTTERVYNLVPWMGIPAVKQAEDLFCPDSTDFKLQVTLVRSTTTLKNADLNAKQRTLRLVSSTLKIIPTWGASSGTGVSDKVVNDITAFTAAAVNIQIDSNVSAGTLAEFREYVEIREVLSDGTYGKTVARVRILFLEKLVQTVFLIEVKQVAETFVFKRLATGQIPLAMEADSASAVHGDILSEANRFGFAQIGIDLELAPATIDMFDKDGNSMFFDANHNPKTFPMPTTVVGDVGNISNSDKWTTLARKFLDKVAEIRGDSAGAVRTYYPLYLFAVSWNADPTSGVTVTNLADLGESPPHHKETYKLFDLIKPNSGLFSPEGARLIEYATLVHECLHSFLVNHYFADEAKSDSTENPIPDFRYFYAAHKWLRFYLSDRFYEKNDVAAKFKNDSTLQDGDRLRVRIEDLIISVRTTLFDDVVDNGMEAALNAFLTTKVFANGILPADWRPNYPATEEPRFIPITDLVLRIAFNDLVKFKRHRTSEDTQTQNVMSYFSSRYPTDSGQTVTYFKRRPVRISRFQWELARADLRRRKALKYV